MGLTIGKLARKAELNVETIRYYQRRGLIPRPVKPKSGYRQYGGETLQKLAFIKRAKTLGFSLDDIHKLLELSTGRCSDVQSIAEQKLHQVKSKLRDLLRLEVALEALVRQCGENTDEAHCPVIEVLLFEER